MWAVHQDDGSHHHEVHPLDRLPLVRASVLSYLAVLDGVTLADMVNGQVNVLSDAQGVSAAR
jgi:hypothetical protein